MSPESVATLEERLVLAADDDRRKIERELHDGVQQYLVALAVNLQRVAELTDADPAAAKTLLGEMGRDVQQALEEAGQLAHRIHPPLLEAGGLAAALRAAAMSAGVPISIDIPAGASYRPEVALTIYLCCVGVIEHATRASLTVRDGDFEIEAEGASSEAAVDRLRDRVEALGGELVSSGTRVTGSLRR